MSTHSNPDLLPWSVLIVEDDAPTRAFFVDCVQRNPELSLCGEAASVAQARELLCEVKASGQRLDALLTDLGLPDGSGLEIIAQVAREHDNCDSLVISMFGDEDNVLASIEAGATGYIHKDAAPDDVAQSILQLKTGASPISPMIARRLLAKYQSLSQEQRAEQKNVSNRRPASVFITQSATKNVANSAPQTHPDQSDAEPARPLSRKETEILEQIARGFSYAELAEIRHVSVHTIQSHIKNIYAKLAVHNRSEAVFEAMRLGYLKPQ